MSLVSRLLLTLACSWALSMGAPPMAAALDGTQTQNLATADGGVKQIEVNLKLSQDSAGPGNTPITGSKARLVATRLEMAKSPVPQVAELIAALPAKDAQVKALVKRFAAAKDGIAALDARLGLKPAAAQPTAAAAEPAAKPAAATSAASGDPKLDYKQEQLAKDARSYLDEIEGLAGGTEDFVKSIKSVKDPLGIDHRQVQSATNSIAKGRERSALVKARIDQLPKNGQGVADLSKRYKELLASLDASDKVIAPLQKKLAALVNPASYPELEADFTRLQQLANMYQEPDMLTVKYERAGAMVSQMAAADAENKRVLKVYGALIKQQTPDGERIEKLSAFFNDNFTAFSAACAKQKKLLPAQMDDDLARIDRMADEAEKEQKIAFFSNGIPDELARTESKLSLLSALDPSKSAAYKAKLDKARQQLKAREIKLEEKIIAQNELPPNRYTAGDRSKLEKLAIASWKKSEAKAEVLAIRIPSKDWEREQYLRWENSAWHVVDHSRLQVQLLVKRDAKVAVIRPIGLEIDHMSKDKLNASPMDAVSDAVSPHRMLLIEKIR